jgi:hypothetical protein
MKPLNLRNRRSGSTPGAARVGPGLARLLQASAIVIEVLDPWTCRLSAVPVGRGFNKPRTNVLLKWMRFTTGANVFVDDDLSYRNPGSRITALLVGPTFNQWRKLRTKKLNGPTDAVVIQALRLLRSPLAAAAQQAISQPAEKNSQRQRTRSSLGPVLRSVGQWIPPAVTAKAAATCVRRDLAQHLATALTRSVAPRSCILGGLPGSGRDHLMLAVAHPLCKRGHIRDVLRVPMARIAAGSVLSTDLDSALAQFLSEALRLRKVLLLVQDLDVCVSGSSVSDSLLCHALDHGLRMLATVRTQSSVDQWLANKALGRRLLTVQLEDPPHKAVERIAADFAATSRLKVLPETIRTAVKLAMRENEGKPAAVISLLAAAIAEAAWNRAEHVAPDNVFASQRHQATRS